MKRKRWKVIGCILLTLAAVTSSLLWMAMAFITVKSFWYTDTFSVLLLDRNKSDHSRQFHFYELSSNCGRLYVRVALRTDDDPFRHDFNIGWFHVRIKSRSRFAENMERLITKYGANPRQFLGFHWADGNPSQKSSDTSWIRFIRCPIWPFLLVFAILPFGLFWRRRRWPCEQRRAATRITLILYSLPIAIASIHLTIPWWDQVQKTQLQQVLDFAAGRPAILAGDFNMCPYEAPVKQVVDSGKFSAKLDGPHTVSSYDPHAKIDYIFVPLGWKLIGHEVIQTDLSDHMPVLSTYRIPLVTDPNSEALAH